MAKPDERIRARKLRQEGWSMRRIAVELGVSISSVSLWVREVECVQTPSPRPDREEPDVGTRRCGRCTQTLSLHDFNRCGDGHQWWCRECFRVYFRERGDLHRRQSGAAQRRRRIEAKILVEEHLAKHPCRDCGESDRIVLEFDHLGSKRGNVSTLRREGLSIKALRSEINGCEVVCVNCHRRRTARRGGSWRLDPAGLDQSGNWLPGERRNMRLVRDHLLAFGCTDCGLRDLVALDFDHVGAKRANVLTLARRGCGVAMLTKEISRCEVRCANCHRRRTVRELRRRAGR